MKSSLRGKDEQKNKRKKTFFDLPLNHPKKKKQTNRNQVLFYGEKTKCFSTLFYNKQTKNNN